MTYKEVLSYLENMPVYDPKKVEEGKIVFNQDAIKALLKEIGNPQNDIKCIHVAGTNGKGSTTEFLVHALLKSGIKVGAYTSPFLIDIREEICINGEIISEIDFAKVVSKVIESNIEVNKRDIYPTAFEIITASAFLYFKEEGCDVAVIETGLGGRTDATNVIENPLVNVITDIGLDHVGILGTSLERIAGEKAGIVQTFSDTIIVDQEPEVIEVFRKKANEELGKLIIVNPLENTAILKNGYIIFTDNFLGERMAVKLKMLGFYQVRNASLAIGVLNYLAKNGYKISKEDVLEGIEEVSRPARFEILNDKPKFIADGSHNEDGVRALVTSLKSNFPNKKITFIVGVLADKDFNEMFDLIKPIASKVYTIKPDNIRAMDSRLLCEMLVNKGFLAKDCKSVEIAIKKALSSATEDDIICAFGSLSYMGELRKKCSEWKERKLKIEI